LPDKPPLLLRSPLTGRVYIVTKYSTTQHGITVADDKYDVTDQYEALIAEVTADAS